MHRCSQRHLAPSAPDFHGCVYRERAALGHALHAAWLRPRRCHWWLDCGQGPGEVVVSRTVTDLVAGSGIGVEDRGEYDLKRVPGLWRLFAIPPT